MKLDETNSSVFKAKEGNPKWAWIHWRKEIYSLSWGTQTFDGPHVRICVDSETYGCDIREFFATHKPVPGYAAHYVKDATVRAAKLTEETEVVTVLNGKEESRSTVPAGHWLVQNPAGEVYYNSPEKFERTYEAV